MYICGRGPRDDDRFQRFLEEAESEAGGLGLSRLACLRGMRACLSGAVGGEAGARVHLAHSLELH